MNMMIGAQEICWKKKYWRRKRKIGNEIGMDRGGAYLCDAKGNL